ncbi:hypothetical protein BN2497_3097 [Janthinobacterium sp. CG23_2]|nr:hypothetical protein BN2497_3097 [Janthinobacterium sp. CG23_2]CUU27946.1 hypothetical protein BN3177_3097 [Janthinobacterium sp. CG23_2]
MGASGPCSMYVQHTPKPSRLYVRLRTDGQVPYALYCVAE